MRRYMRLFVLISCVPLLAFSCLYFKQISVDVSSDVIQPLDKVSSPPEEKYEVVLEIFHRWVANYQFKKIDCSKGWIGLDNSHPELCEGYIIYYQSRGLVATATLYVNVFIFHDQKIGKPIIEFFEGSRTNQSKKSKQMEKELSDLLSERIGKDAIQVIRR